MPTRFDRFVLPLCIAAIVTGLNALKPPGIDDPAYLAVARQIARQPFDPYGFEQFWYTWPQHANDVLAPPVVPYWLGLGIALFGEQPVLLKLWLFPLALLLVFGLRSLLRRVARGVESPMLVAVLLSPAILPAFNFMLDVPSLALVIAALVMMMRALEGPALRWYIVSGILAGLAAQTKYTGGLGIPLLVGTAIIYGRVRGALATGAMASTVFLAWEVYTHVIYGSSHFVNAFTGSRDSLIHRDWIGASAVSLMGGVGPPIVLMAAAVFTKRMVGVLPVIAALVGTYIAFLTIPDTVHCLWLPESLRIGSGYSRDVFHFWGWFAIAIPLLTLLRLAVCCTRRTMRIRISRPLIVLGLWLVLEWTGYFTMTYFPAARRVIGVTVVSLLIVARLASRRRLGNKRCRAMGWAAAATAGLGMVFAGTDIADSHLEPSAMRQAVAEIRATDPEGRIWYTGHWGFQYEAERQGIQPLIPDGSVLTTGDWLIAAPFWVAQQEYQPNPGLGTPWRVVQITRRWPLRTVPPYHGGARPIEWWPGPVIEVHLYRLQRDWFPTRD